MIFNIKTSLNCPTKLNYVQINMKLTHTNMNILNKILQYPTLIANFMRRAMVCYGLEFDN